MGQELLYALASAAIISLISVFAAIPFFITKKVSDRVQLILLSVSVGALLGAVFLDFVPELAEHGYNEMTAAIIILGVLVFFVIERLVHHHHGKPESMGGSAHGHAYHLAPVNLIGDGIHNFLDGMVIGSTFLVSPALGVSASISIAFHEIPQEIADFGVILYSGYSRKKALFFNFLSALTAMLGVAIAFLLSSSVESFTEFAIPFACGNFIYIAATNLLPQLHRHCSARETVEHILAIILGVAMLYAVTTLGLAHVH